MCSILGYFNSKLSFEDIVKYNATMSHRGPDNSTCRGYSFLDKELVLCHNRLAIQDLDIKANQPMENDRFVLVFNGEVYNHFEIRQNLKHQSFITHSDTETILWAFTEKGLAAIDDFIGMFALALFDKVEQKLYLIRDRVGIKPLYWTFQSDEFAFSSEFKGFSSYLKENKCDKAVVQFMSLGYMPKDATYFSGIYKLQPGYILEFDGKDIKQKKYWELPSSKTNISFESAVEDVERLIHSSVRYRLLSDLEVGSFLSGGVDSSLVSAIMQKEASKNVKTFSIGFENPEYNEAEHAKAVASYLGTDHYEYIFGAKDVMDLLEDFDSYFDEPFGDASSLPMMLLSKITKDKVTVALSGDGGDELFLGYDRYFITTKYHNYFKKIPQIPRALISKIFQATNIDKLEKLAYPLKNLNFINLYSILNTAVKPWELEQVFNKEFLHNCYSNNIDFLDLQEADLQLKCIDDLSRLDFYRYLPDDILTKVDRASMAYSLEARVPLLDHRIVEYAYSLSEDVKTQYGKKSILKHILYKYVPKDLIERPKKGFSVPLKHWFRDELKDLVFDKIDSLDERFNKKEIRKIANLHIYKNKNYEYILWNLMRVK